MKLILADDDGTVLDSWEFHRDADIPSDDDLAVAYHDYAPNTMTGARSYTVRCVDHSWRVEGCLTRADGPPTIIGVDRCDSEATAIAVAESKRAAAARSHVHLG